MVHRLTNGIPRLINLVCDRALLSGFSERTNRITPEMVVHAAESLDVQPALAGGSRGPRARASMVAAAAVVLAASALAVGASALVYRAYASGFAVAYDTPSGGCPAAPR